MSSTSALDALAPAASTTSTALSLKEGEVLSLSDLRTISEGEMESVITLLGKWDMTDFTMSLLDSFEFDGFDPQMVWRQVAFVKKRDGLDDATIKKEVGTLVGIGILKGNISSKNWNNLSDAARQALNYLFKRYGIVMKSDRKKVAMTIPRFVAAFPYIASVISREKPKNFTGIFGSDRLPGIMKHTAFASLVPIGTSITPMLLAACTAYSCDQTIVLKNLNITTTDKVAVEKIIREQGRFTQLSFNSSAVTSTRRPEFVRDLGLHMHFKAVESVCISMDVKQEYMVTQDQWDAEFVKMSAKSLPAPPV
jgi:hypothetical protein